MVDANGALERVAALELANELAAFGVCWFEEPVSSDDLAGLRWLRDRTPPGMSTTPGDYGRAALSLPCIPAAGPAGVLQAHHTPGVCTGFLRRASPCDSHQ